MKKTIAIEYEIRYRVYATVDVEEEDLANLLNTSDLDVLEKYDITSQSMTDMCSTDGWMESDFCVVDDKDGKVIIPWSDSPGLLP